MPHISDRFSESVSGVVVGKIMFIGRLFYEDRPQCHSFTSESEEGLEKIANENYNRIKKEMGVRFRELYPNDEWRLRIYTDS